MKGSVVAHLSVHWTFLNAALFIMRTGSLRRVLPPSYGHRNTVYVRFRRLAKNGFWESLVAKFTDHPDLEWVMIDASHIKVHQHGMGAQGGTEDAGMTKGGINTKLHAVVDSNGMPINFIITAGTTADCTQAISLLEGLSPEYVLADRGYDTDEIVQYVENHSAVVVIPPKRNRKEQRQYDKHLYKLRHLVENYFQKVKKWRNLATRYVKTTLSFASYLSYIQYVDVGKNSLNSHFYPVTNLSTHFKIFTKWMNKNQD